MSRVRTVLGDIDAADLGTTYAHEHLVIDPGRPVDMNPDFLLADVDLAVAELEPVRALGLAAIVEAMPCSAGRNIVKLAEISRRTGIHVVAPTGLHLAKYYAPGHWSHEDSAERLAERFIADIEEGIDALDYLGPTIERTGHRAGVIKVAGSEPHLTPLERRHFEAAALAHRRTGAPILTHCTEGRAGPEQLALLADHGVEPRRVVLSHTDKVVDRGYHRELLATGASVEYDQTFRWGAGAENGTLTLLRWMLEDGYGGQLMLGMDAARQRYWTVYGGTPGWTFLLDGFTAAMRTAGIDAAALDALFVANPARAYALGPEASSR